MGEFGVSILQNFIYDILKFGCKSVFGDDQNLEDEFVKTTEDTFDLISAEYPIANFIDGYTFWDYISMRVVSIKEDDRFYKKYNSFEKFITSLLLENCKQLTIEDIKNICTRFYEIFNLELVKTEYLHKYIQNEYLQDILIKISNLTDLLNKTINSFQKVDANSLSNYIMDIYEYTSKKMRGLYFETKFADSSNINIEFEQIIKDSKRYLILGDAGSGKTFALDRLANIISSDVIKNSNTRIPIVLQLSGYGVNYDSIIDGALKRLNVYIPTVVEADILQALNKGIIILVLDGLDEVKSEHYMRCINDIKNLLVNKGIKTIISSRKNTYSSELSELTNEIFIKNLNEVYIRDILDKIGVNNRGIDRELLKILDTPLLLNITIEVINKNDGIMPKNKVDLYNEFMNTLTSNWSKKKGIRILPISKVEMTRILCNLAFECFQCNYITYEKLYEYLLKSSVQNLEEAFQYIISVGIFDIVNDESIIFKHKTFKEYFAAKYLVQRFCNEASYDIASKFLSDKDWYQVYIFAAGLFDDWKKQDKFLEMILENNLKLYISCVNEKKVFEHLFKNMSDEDYSELYLHTLVNTYEKIINKYFNQIKFSFDPYCKRNRYKPNSQICIIGRINDKRYLHYTYFIENMKCNKVKIASDKEVNSHIESCSNARINTVMRYTDLELSNKNIDSARQKAIEDIKSGLKSIIEKKKFIEDKYILCERISNDVKKLPIKDYTEIENVRKWVEGKLKEGIARSSKKGIWAGYTYNDIELEKMYIILKKMEKNNISLKECKLPIGDLDPKTNCYLIWEVYSKERLMERIKVFFMFFKSSFIELVENNLYELRMQLPEYVHLPYKYFVEVIFYEKHKEDNCYFEPTGFKYYYLADEMNSFEPEISELNRKSDVIDTFDKIKKSYLGKKRYTEQVSVSSTATSSILQNMCISEFVYDLIKKNLEYVFGKL